MRPPFVRAATAVPAAVVAACLAAASFAQEPPPPTLSPPSNVAAPNVASSQPGLNQGVSPRSPEKSAIQQLLADTVDAAVSKGEFSTLESHLSKANQDKIGDLRDKQWSDLDGRIDEFRKDWCAKFGIDFKLGDKQSVVFADDSFPIHPASKASENDGHPQAGMPTTMPGTMPAMTPTTAPSDTSMEANPTGSGAALAGPTSEPSAGAMGAGGAQASAFPNQPPVGAIGNDPSQSEAMMVKSGTVTLPETPTAAASTIELVNEGQVVPLWRIRLPADVDAQRLHDSLLSRLTKLDENPASWPTEINQAYQAVAREILAGLVDPAATTQP